MVKLNPYDPCLANKMVSKTQLAIVWHVTDLETIHKDPIVIGDFTMWIKKTYGKIDTAKMVQGKIHDCLGMKLDYQVKGQVSIDIVTYIKSMVNDFLQEDFQGPKVLHHGTRICLW